MSVVVENHPFVVVRTHVGTWEVPPGGCAHPKLLAGLHAGKFPWPRRVTSLRFLSGTGLVITQAESVDAIPTAAEFSIRAAPGVVMSGDFMCEKT